VNEAFSEPQVDHGAWEYEPATKRTRWSEGLYAIHGVARESFELTVENVRPLVHPDDRDTYTEIVRDAIATRTPFACQHRIVRPDGETRILIVRGSFVAGSDGIPDRLIGTTQDVSAREEEESRMRHLAHAIRSRGSTTAIASSRSSRARSTPGDETVLTARS